MGVGTMLMLVIVLAVVMIIATKFFKPFVEFVKGLFSGGSSGGGEG